MPSLITRQKIKDLVDAHSHVTARILTYNSINLFSTKMNESESVKTVTVI